MIDYLKSVPKWKVWALNTAFSAINMVIAIILTNPHAVVGWFCAVTATAALMGVTYNERKNSN